MPTEAPEAGRAERRDALALLRPMLLGSLSFGVLTFVLPIYGKRMGASAVEIGGMFSALAVTMAATRPLLGWALDRFGRKAFFVAGLAFRSTSMALFALAAGLDGLYLARLAQGFAASLTWIPAYTIVTDLTSIEERGRFVGKVDEAGARGELFGAIAGFSLLALVPLETGWKMLFAAYALLAGAGAWLAQRTVPETHGRRPAPVSEDGRGGFSPGLLKLIVVVFTASASMSMVPPLLMILLQDKFTTNVALLAAAYIPASVVNSFMPSRLGRLSDRFGRAPLIALGLTISGLGSLLLPSLPSIGWLVALWILEALGGAMAAPAQEALVADLTRHDVRGTGYGLNSTAGSVGGIFGPLLGGWLYDAMGHAVPFYANGVVVLASAVWALIALKGLGVRG